MDKLLLSIFSAASVVLVLQGADVGQIRFSSAYHPYFHDKVKEPGFNLVGNSRRPLVSLYAPVSAL